MEVSLNLRRRTCQISRAASRIKECQQDDWNNPNQQNPNQQHSGQQQGGQQQTGQQKNPQSDRNQFDKDQQKRRA